MLSLDVLCVPYIRSNPAVRNWLIVDISAIEDRRGNKFYFKPALTDDAAYAKSVSKRK